jgi:hypothetical protein
MLEQLQMSQQEYFNEDPYNYYSDNSYDSPLGGVDLEHIDDGLISERDRRFEYVIPRINKNPAQTMKVRQRNDHNSLKKQGLMNSANALERVRDQKEKIVPPKKRLQMYPDTQNSQQEEDSVDDTPDTGVHRKVTLVEEIVNRAFRDLEDDESEVFKGFIQLVNKASVGYIINDSEPAKKTVAGILSRYGQKAAEALPFMILTAGEIIKYNKRCRSKKPETIKPKK